MEKKELKETTDATEKAEKKFVRSAWIKSKTSTTKMFQD